MNNKPYVSREADRRAHQALCNIHSLQRYHSQKQLLEQKKDALAQQVMAEFKRCNIGRLSTVIQCAQRQLEKGLTYQEAVTYARQYLTETPA